MSSSRPRASDRAFTYYARLQRVKRHLERNLSEDLPLAKAARIASMNETYFCEFFHEKVGVQFKRWVDSVRIRHAKELMESRNLSISTIAFEVGFGSLRTFERTFKLHTALTPSAYKQQVQPVGSRRSLPRITSRHLHGETT